jgi:hypothetical protein
MKRVLLFSGTLPWLIQLPSFAGVPEMNVQTICNAKAALAKLSHFPPDQSKKECV